MILRYYSFVTDERAKYVHRLPIWVKSNAHVNWFPRPLRCRCRHRFCYPPPNFLIIFPLNLTVNLFRLLRITGILWRNDRTAGSPPLPIYSLYTLLVKVSTFSVLLGQQNQLYFGQRDRSQTSKAVVLPQKRGVGSYVSFSNYVRCRTAGCEDHRRRRI